MTLILYKEEGTLISKYVAVMSVLHIINGAFYLLFALMYQLNVDLSKYTLMQNLHRLLEVVVVFVVVNCLEVIDSWGLFVLLGV